MNLLLSLLIAHLAADFPLQGKRMAEQKHRQFRPLLVHLGVHSLCTASVLSYFYLTGQIMFSSTFYLFSVIIVSHAVIDRSQLKRIIKPASAFWLDQLLHIGIIIGLVAVMFPISWPSDITLSFQVLWIILWSLIATELVGRGIAPLLLPFAPRLIESHFERKVTRKEQLNGISRSVTHEVEDSARSYTTEINGVGRYIGLVERAIIVILVAVNAVGAIGFVIALKALARFKQFEDRRFAEYYIIGSLLSILSALLCGLAIQLVL
ncbi:DUF3307 domain-containing protein [Exiguobacterium sp. s193]|uniref:DUF3307 domain-containing protein n=1 Tax=Exiguobacterium sp. s193 TaxID=2751207 RepID=UPI001BE6A2C7|nr:DUF3307 domain-containing protein [Exiguobacterium sp. s193]